MTIYKDTTFQLWDVHGIIFFPIILNYYIPFKEVCAVSLRELTVSLNDKYCRSAWIRVRFASLYRAFASSGRRVFSLYTDIRRMLAGKNYGYNVPLQFKRDEKPFLKQKVENRHIMLILVELVLTFNVLLIYLS